MSPGYSSKIYKKRKKTFLPYILAFFFLLTLSVILFINKGRKREAVIAGQPLITGAEAVVKVPSQAEEIEKKISEIPESERKEDLPEIKNEANVNGITRDELLSIQNRALFYAKSKQYEKAVDEYNILLEFNKRHLTIIGMCYYWMNENEKALTTLLDANDREFYPYRTKKFLAFTYYSLNDLSSSLTYAESALELGSDPELIELIRKLKQEENVMKGYKDLGMEHFVFQFSREEHDQLRTLVSDYLKGAYREIGKRLDYFPNKQFVVILYNEKDFFDVTRAPGWAGGLYDGKIRIPVRGLEGQNNILKKVIYHEYTHALISEITRKCPLWINEGLAEYFSSENENLNIREPIPLKYLERGFPAGNPAYVSLAYRTSHSAVRYMIDKYGIYSIVELLKDFEENGDINSAFESVLYVTYDDFISKWTRNLDE
ncbi:MAG: hypothetical protein ABFR75_11525 [Acidobacteriota bacterium]